ncbi:DUF397 domain-containing protein [Streptomyces sp. S4.7]|uniref:DUF397 domain-containing protein n=1 Tax=Streptomyces sp. S4.7 TaxID=2705439 RepID=UPI001EF2891E|nr:DUF397 domain-containing protein [Streptomyces sp. S4.7]
MRGTTLTDSKWRRSSFCAGGGNNCVEVATTEDGRALRDSSRPSGSFTTKEVAFRALIRGVKAGVFTPLT